MGKQTARLSVIYKTSGDNAFVLDLLCNTDNTEMTETLHSERLRRYSSPMPSAFGLSFDPRALDRNAAGTERFYTAPVECALGNGGITHVGTQVWRPEAENVTSCVAD